MISIYTSTHTSVCFIFSSISRKHLGMHKYTTNNEIINSLGPQIAVQQIFLMKENVSTKSHSIKSERTHYTR
uniref:Uncharacterized protein n=1 Tax=Rhizophora mucronata TaxID=61149 RepID=A0A2P2P0C7_RHIMU